jgi:hypothetical protein
MLVTYACLDAEPMHEEPWIPLRARFPHKNIDLLVRFVFEEAISNPTVIKATFAGRNRRAHGVKLLTSFPRHSAPKYFRAFTFAQQHSHCSP